MPKRGLIILITAWSVLLLAPMFRTQTRRTIDNLDGGERGYYVLRDDWSEVKKLNPGNAQLAFLDLQRQNYPRTPQYWRDLDALVARFPNDLYLRRARLTEAMRPAQLVRTIYWLDKHPAPSPRVNANQTSAGPNAEQRAAMISAARAGEKQAPDDGFFSWVQAMALWDRNEEPSLRALERAAKATSFDDGVMANQRALIALRETQAPLQWDEKIAIMSSALLPHYAIMREMARQVTWSGIEHYRRGDKAGAYRRWRAILGASAAFRRAQSQGPEASVIGVLVAEAMERLVWGNVATELNSPAVIAGAAPKGAASGIVDGLLASDERYGARLRAFAQLARRDGQVDLATYALRENAKFEGRKLGRATSENLDKLGFEAPVNLASIELPWVGRLIFWLSVAGGLSLLVCLIWRWRVGGARWFSASGAQIAFFGSLWLGALALALWGRVSYQMRQLNGLTGDSTEVSAASALFNFFSNSGAIWTSICATLALSIAFCYWQSAREQSRLQRQTLPRAQAATANAWLPKLGALAWVTVVISTLAWFAVGGDAPVARTVWIICSLLALGLSLWRIERDDEAKTPSRLAWASVFCGLISLGLSAQFGILSDNSALYVAATSLFVALAILVYLAANSRDWRAAFPSATATALQTLGGVAAICAIALLLASLAALPIRTRQNRIVDDYIARGEIDWMKNQPEIRNVSKPVKRN